MKKESIPYVSPMNMKTALSNAVAVEIAPGKKLVWIAGQLPFDENGQFVGVGDIAVQTEQAIRNIQGHLAKFCATLDNVVVMELYVKRITDLKAIHEVRLKYFKEPYPASTLVQISELAHPDCLIEISAQAVVDVN